MHLKFLKMHRAALPVNFVMTAFSIKRKSKEIQ